jgi:hypothetical protein
MCLCCCVEISLNLFFVALAETRIIFSISSDWVWTSCWTDRAIAPSSLSHTVCLVLFLFCSFKTAQPQGNAPQHDSFFQHSRARWSVAVGELPPVLSVGQRMGSEARAALLLPEKQDPVVHSRPDGTRHISTSFFGREGLILETLKSGQIETVQIF